MSVDYYGDFILGVRLTASTIMTVERSCLHSLDGFQFDTRIFKYCPQCGKSLSTRQTLPAWIQKSTVDNFDIVTGTDDEYVIVGRHCGNRMCFGNGGEDAIQRVPDANTKDHRLHNLINIALASNGLTPDQLAQGLFGFWFSVHCSY